MFRTTRPTAPLASLLLLSCSSAEPGRPAPEMTGKIPTTSAGLIASDDSWGNTEGPAVDSEGALYFTSRGTYKGIIRWTPETGAQEYAVVAAKAGPGGLWIDADDNIYLTATGEREIQILKPDGSVATIAANFENNPDVATGPNDITVSAAGVVYFTDPNGYYGESEPGTVYRIDQEGQVSIFDDTVVGPNGIILSADDRTLYVAHNTAQHQSQLVRWPLAEDGSAAGPKELVAEIEPCVADGMAVDAQHRVWLTCYSYGTAHLIQPESGQVVQRVTTEEEALTNAAFGRGPDRHSLYLTSSDMDRVVGYVYRAQVDTPGVR